MDASETDVKHEICKVIRSSSIFDKCGPNDFQFIDMNGKQASVPKCKSGFVWDGQAVKEIVGCGSLYVRLNDIGVLADVCSSCSDEHNLLHITVIGLGNSDEVDDHRAHLINDLCQVTLHIYHQHLPISCQVIVKMSLLIMQVVEHQVFALHTDEGQELAKLSQQYQLID